MSATEYNAFVLYILAFPVSEGIMRKQLTMLFPVVAIFASAVAGAAESDADHYGIPQVKFINEQTLSAWTESGLQPSPSATEGEWCRRVHLDLIGRIPNVKDLHQF